MQAFNLTAKALIQVQSGPYVDATDTNHSRTLRERIYHKTYMTKREKFVSVHLDQRLLNFFVLGILREVNFKGGATELWSNCALNKLAKILFL